VTIFFFLKKRRFLHFFTNIFLLLLFGWILETIHGWLRTCLIYFSGVLIGNFIFFMNSYVRIKLISKKGSLSIAVLDEEACLAGSSAGLCAILTSLLADVFLVRNFH
jgi:membrane associated rhomboid family serine protease